MEEGFKACPFCAEPIREAAKICRFCNRTLEPLGPAVSSPSPQPVPANVQWQQDKTALGLTPSHVGRNIFVAFLIAVSVLALFLISSQLNPRPGVPGAGRGSPLAAIIPHPVSFAVLNGDLAVAAGTVTSIPFTVPPGASLAHLRGTFQSAGGSGNDIEAGLLTQPEFENWQNGHYAHGFYFSGKTTTGEINVGPLPPGDYALGFSNRFSLMTPKTVSGNVTLTYLR